VARGVSITTLLWLFTDLGARRGTACTAELRIAAAQVLRTD